MTSIHFDIRQFKIQSTNHSKIPMKLKTGKQVLVPDPKYRKTKNDLIILLQEQIPPDFKPFCRNIVVTITITTYKDLDNCLKLIIDALQGARVFMNDSKVLKINAGKIQGRLGKPEDIVISVLGFPEEDLFESDTEQRNEDAVSLGGTGR